MRRSLPRLGRTAALLLAAIALAVAATACDDDDDEASEAEIQEVEEVFTRTFESSGENADYFFEHVTDNLIQTVLFAPSREECEAAAAECIGAPGEVERISGTEIDGDQASLTVDSNFGTYDVGMVREDDVWKVDTFQAVSDEVPDGAEVIDLELTEFLFTFDPDEIPSDGNFAFNATNDGEQVHEVVVISIPEDGDLQSAIEAAGAGEVEPLAFKVFIQPGQDVNVAFEEPLAPGRYGLVCALPDTSDPEMPPHFEKGMLAQFTVE